jgi:hypothetical protein
MPCTVKKTFEAVREVTGELLVQVKSNQPTLLKDMDETAQASEPAGRIETIDAGKRSRHETRLVEVFEAPASFTDADWNGLVAAVVRVTRTTLTRRPANGMWKRREGVSYYASSARISAAKAAKAIRGHWGTENRNHYVRDVSMLGRQPHPHQSRHIRSSAQLEPQHPARQRRGERRKCLVEQRSRFRQAAHIPLRVVSVEQPCGGGLSSRAARLVDGDRQRPSRERRRTA